MSKVLKSHDVVIVHDTITIPEMRAYIEVKNSQLVEPKNKETQSIINMKAYLAEQEEKLIIKKGQIIQEASSEAMLIKQQAKQEAALIKKQAYETGFREGSQLKVKQIKECLDNIDETLDIMNKSVNEKMINYEENLHNLAISIASKILAKTIDSDDLALLELTKQVVASIKKSGWIEIVISDKLDSLLKTLEKELSEITGSNKVNIIPQDKPKGTCIVETDYTIIDASIYEQLDNLKACFKQIDPLWRD